MKSGLPQSIEAEIAVLGGILQDPTGDALDLASGLVMAHFLTRSHAILWDGIKTLHKDGKPVDPISLTNYLRTRNRLEEVGGDHFIFSLTRKVPTSAHTKFYVELLKDKLMTRKVLDLCSRFSELAQSADGSKELISQLESEVITISSDSVANEENQTESALKQLDNIIDLQMRKEKRQGLASGIPAFDGVTGGFRKSLYYVIGARASTGKTAFADQVAVNMINRNVPILYIGLESSEERIIGKIVSKHASVPYSAFSRGNCTDDELKRMKVSKNRVQKSGFILVRPNDITGPEIRSIIRREKRNHSIELVIVDYLQKVKIPDRWEERRAIGEASKQIHRACVETGVPALVLVQLNREAEKDARARMFHIKESGQIEQDADFIGLLFSDVDKYEHNKADYLPMMLSIEKNKDGISGTDQRLYFDGEMMMFREEKRFEK